MGVVAPREGSGGRGVMAVRGKAGEVMGLRGKGQDIIGLRGKDPGSGGHGTDQERPGVRALRGKVGEIMGVKGERSGVMGSWHQGERSGRSQSQAGNCRGKVRLLRGKAWGCLGQGERS